MTEERRETQGSETGGEVGRLIALISEHYVFDPAAYPVLDGASEETRRIFGVRHCALHLAKLAGQVASVSEAADHTSRLDIADIRAIASKTLINALKLAEIAGMDDVELVRSVELRYGAATPAPPVKRAR